MQDRDETIEEQFRAIDGTPGASQPFSAPTLTPSNAAFGNSAARRILDNLNDTAEPVSRPASTPVHGSMLGDRSESSFSSVVTPRSIALSLPDAKRDPRATRRGVVTYDDSPQQPGRSPVFQPTSAPASTSSPEISSDVPKGNTDVPFLPPPGTPLKDDMYSPMLEPVQTMATPPSPRSASPSSTASHTHTDGRIRAKAAQLVNDSSKERGIANGTQAAPSVASSDAFVQDAAAAGTGQGLQAPPQLPRHSTSTSHHAVPSPEQERQSKRAVEVRACLVHTLRVKFHISSHFTNFNLARTHLTTHIRTSCRDSRDNRPITVILKSLEHNSRTQWKAIRICLLRSFPRVV